MQPLQSTKRGIWNRPLRQLGQPRIAEPSRPANGRPTAPMAVQQGEGCIEHVGRVFVHGAQSSNMLLDSQPLRQHHPARACGQTGDMRELTARAIVAENIRRLLRLGGSVGLPSTQAELARRSGVAQTSISNWLDDSRAVSPTIDKLEAVARVYGLEAWQLMMREVTDDLALAGHLKKLVTVYPKIGAHAREYIERVAEAEAAFEAQPGRREGHTE